jgi:LytS/YehU family sensor histidine kinase
MDISMEGDSLHMKLANGMMPGTSGVQEIPANGLTNVQKRLTLIYPQQHELKISGEQEMLIVHLKIQLSSIAALAAGKHEEPEVEELV